jgi:hypothetical protein
MLLGWDDVVEGVFEIREQAGVACTAVNLVDELTYRIYTNAGPGFLDQLPSGCFMIARIVPFATAAGCSAGRRVRSEHPRVRRSWRSPRRCGKNCAAASANYPGNGVFLVVPPA